MSPFALRRVAKRLEDGAEKYGERNWEKGQPLTSYLDSALSHILRELEGDKSEDHAAAVGWNMDAYMHTEEMILRGVLPSNLDDRPVYTPNRSPNWSPISGSHIRSAFDRC